MGKMCKICGKIPSLKPFKIRVSKEVNGNGEPSPVLGVLGVFKL